MHECQNLIKSDDPELGRLLVYTQNNPSSARGVGFSGQVVDVETGEIYDFSERERHYLRRAERWALKAVVNRMMPRSRTAKCRNWVIPHKTPSVLKTQQEQGAKAFYANLEVCSSVWVCPCCAAKISERRRQELKQAMDSAKSLGLSVCMLTLTVPHTITDDLKDLLDSLQKAHGKLWQDTAGKRLIERFGIVGRIRAFEVTHGPNGFHPHFHILLFTSAPVTPSDLLEAVYPVWVNACTKKGLKSPSRAHGVAVNDGTYAAKYVTKWGLEDEMTKGHVKEAKGSSMFDLLRRLLDDSTDTQAKRLFSLYATAFKGRRQLVWTNGLKDLLSVEVRTDEQLATEDEEEADEFASLTLEQWQAVRWWGAEFRLLRCAEEKPNLFWQLVDSLTTSYQSRKTPQHAARSEETSHRAACGRR